MAQTTSINRIKTRVAANSGGTTISPLRSLLRVVNSCAMTHPMAKTIITVPRMAMVLRDSALSLLIEISRAKHHPMERVNFTLGSISWRFGGHGFDVFESYTGRAFGAAPLCG
jgi:hypothetical protein